MMQRLVSTKSILVETFALLQARLGLEAVMGFQQDVVPMLHVEFITSDLHRLGIAALLSVSRRALSLVHCVSFEVMRSLAIKIAFTFDSRL
jgi:predicted nucleic acid-binding protein